MGWMIRVGCVGAKRRTDAIATAKCFITSLPGNGTSISLSGSKVRGTTIVMTDSIQSQQAEQIWENILFHLVGQ